MKKNDILKNIVIYMIVFLFVGIDYIVSLRSGQSVLVYATFLIIAMASLVLFITDKGFITIDKMIYIYIFIFAYYTPFHQYINNTTIHNFTQFSNNEYFYSNCLILLFIFVYTVCKKIIFRNIKLSILKEKKLILTHNKMNLLKIISIFALILLIIQGALFSTSNDTDGDISNILLKFERFIPISILIMYFSIKKNDGFYNISNKTQKRYFILISIICILIFFPFNGTISRYLLFGTYILVFAIIFEKSRWKSIILLTAILGFYFIFPAFNFFKTHTLNEISEFSFGGFDVDFIDYDAYEMGMATIRYVKYNGILWGKNLLTALFCFIPRSILTIKLPSSPEIIGSYFKLPFLNLSCPFYAETYLAGGIVGTILSTVFFAYIIRIVEIGKESNNYIFYGLYYISIGMVFAFMRGAILPMTSFWMILSLTYIGMCSFIKKMRKDEG